MLIYNNSFESISPYSVEFISCQYEFEYEMRIKWKYIHSSCSIDTVLCLAKESIEQMMVMRSEVQTVVTNNTVTIRHQITIKIIPRLSEPHASFQPQT